MEALDANGDHEISASEIENAVNVLKSFDRNGDGKLSDADRPENQGPPQGGPPERGPGGPGGNFRRAGGASASDFANRIREFDKNQDGMIDKDELPPRMQAVVKRYDHNNDGSLDKSELDQIALKEGNGPGVRGAGGPGEVGPGGPGRGRPPGRGPGGPPSPERFVQHAMMFDADGDRKLSEAELLKFAKELGPPPGGPPGGGPPPGEADEDRPQHPRHPGGGGG
jgi:Ca2+-binding EF-hand superfamily protein